MPTECNAELFEFAPVDRRIVVAGFDGSAITDLLLAVGPQAKRLCQRAALYPGHEVLVVLT
jgi:hypothetical protein